MKSLNSAKRAAELHSRNNGFTADMHAQLNGVVGLEVVIAVECKRVC